jgi:CubicO group peptidase (beta-lactamase class C family)
MSFTTARGVLEHAIAARAFPAAVVEVGDATRPLWREPLGRLTYEADATPATLDTIFDLASLTKVVATAPLVMRQVERGRLSLDDRIADLREEWRGSDRAAVTVRDLLAHCSGLPAHLPLYRDHDGRAAFARAIAATALEYPPRSRSIYSDLGFMLLGFILEDIASLHVQLEAMLLQMGGIHELQFHPPAVWRPRLAPTSVDPWRGRLLVGEVEDENAAALGGAAAHAGLFGTAGAVGEYARHVLQVLDGRVGAFQADMLRTFITRRADVPGSSRALGWDTMLPTSSCGSRFSPSSFGHTGYTGTSLWIDPERGVYVVLLTNRVHPARGNDTIATVRPAFHDAVMMDLDRN